MAAAPWSTSHIHPVTWMEVVLVDDAHKQSQTLKGNGDLKPAAAHGKTHGLVPPHALLLTSELESSLAGRSFSRPVLVYRYMSISMA